MSDPKNPGVTVIVATYNRAAILRKTLERMSIVERDGLSVEWVFVDNNSTDDTRQLLLSYAEKLPIEYLFEGKPGKNCALNRALREAALREIVVFTDDDILPRKDWLRQIVTVSKGWPKFDIFGGKIEVVWPEGRELRIPDKIKRVCFGHHDFGNEAKVYEKNWHPFGGNFWMRKRLLDTGCSFDEAMGPRPRSRISGGESSLLVKLEKQGHGMLYCPWAVVEHLIEAKETYSLALLKRAYRTGRGFAHLDGIKDASLYQQAANLWLLRQSLKLGYDGLKIMIGFGPWSQRTRVNFNYDSMANAGWILESFRLLRCRKIAKDAR